MWQRVRSGDQAQLGTLGSGPGSGHNPWSQGSPYKKKVAKVQEIKNPCDVTREGEEKSRKGKAEEDGRSC